MNMCKFLLSLFLFLLSSSALAQYDSLYSPYRRFSLDVQYTTFNDLVQNTGNEILDLDAVVNFNLNFRFYRSFSLVISSGQAASWSYKGLGLKIDLPGLFFFEGRPSDFIKKAKKRDWNSYFSVSKLISQQDGTTDSFICDRLGFGLDMFLISGLYLNGELNIFSYQGNQFISPVVGVGFEF